MTPDSTTKRVALEEERSVVTPNSWLPCHGWSGPTHERLITLSLKDFLEQRLESRSNTIQPQEIYVFPLASVFNYRKDYSKFVIESNATMSNNMASDLGLLNFTIRGVSCDRSTVAGLLCQCCKRLSVSLSNINIQATTEISIVQLARIRQMQPTYPLPPCMTRLEKSSHQRDRTRPSSF